MHYVDTLCAKSAEEHLLLRPNTLFCNQAYMYYHASYNQGILITKEINIIFEIKSF